MATGTGFTLWADTPWNAKSRELLYYMAFKRVLAREALLVTNRTPLLSFAIRIALKLVAHVWVLC
jgi:hypothetical protein